jgi:hypothetical protein
MANSTLGCGVVNTSYSAGLVSTVDETGARSIGVVTHITGDPNPLISGDPRVLGFKHNGADRALIASYRYTTGSAGDAVFGIYDPTTWSLIVQKTTTDWGFSNPYGLVVIGDDLFVQDYDSGTITKVDMAGGYTSSAVYTVTPASGYTAHGNGMDYYNDGSDDYLVAVYSQVDASYNYTNSILVLLDVSTSPVTATIVSVNNNAVSVSVDGDYAYVSSSGGSQVPGGNGANSKLEVIDLLSSAVSATITAATTTPSTFGDFVDTAFVAGSAYVLLANYNSTYTTYTYQIIKTTAAALQGGSFGTNSNYSTTTPAGATWLLAPDSSLLWFVSGNVVNLVNTSIPLSSGAITGMANATNGSSSGIGLGNAAINGLLNTASVVIEKTVLAKAEVAARTVARTKSAIRFVLPEKEQQK